MPNLDHLPSELLLLIVQYLEHTDRVALQQTCSTCLQLLTPVVWQSIIVSGHGKGCKCGTDSCYPRKDEFAWSSFKFWEMNVLDNVYEFSTAFMGVPQRTLYTGDGKSHNLQGGGLLDPRYRHLFGDQLKYVRKVMFLHSFFQDNSEGTGKGVDMMAQWFKTFTKVETISLVFGKQDLYDRALYRRENQTGLSENMLLMMEHPLLRYDLWMQPVMDVWPPQKKIQWELHLGMQEDKELYAGNNNLQVLGKMFRRGYRIHTLTLHPKSNDREIDMERNTDYDDRLEILNPLIIESIKNRGLKRLNVEHHRMDKILADAEGLECLRLYNRVPTQLPKSLRDFYIDVYVPATLELDLMGSNLRRLNLDNRTYLSDATIATLPRCLQELSCSRPKAILLDHLGPNLTVLQIKNPRFSATELLKALPRFPKLRTLHVSINDEHRVSHLFKLSKKFLQTYLLAPEAPKDRLLVVLFPEGTYHEWLEENANFDPKTPPPSPMPIDPDERRPVPQPQMFIEHAWEGPGMRTVAEFGREERLYEFRHGEEPNVAARWEVWGVSILAEWPDYWGNTLMWTCTKGRGGEEGKGDKAYKKERGFGERLGFRGQAKSTFAVL